jgi:hypothetical protein
MWKFRSYNEMVIEMLPIGDGPYAQTTTIRLLTTNNAGAKQNDCSLIYKVTNYYNEFSKKYFFVSCRKRKIDHHIRF